MKKIYIKNKLAFLFFTLTSLNIFGQQWQWAKAISMPFGTGVQACTDASGNFYLADHKWDQNNGFPNGSCLIKFDNNGNEIWRKTWYDKMRIRTIQCDSLQNILVGGDFRDTIQINGAPYLSQSANDGFIFSLTAAGNTNWFKAISGTGDEDIMDIHVDYSGNIFYTGKFSNNANIEGTPLNTNGISSTFIAKLNNVGSMSLLITGNTVDSGRYNGGFKLKTDASGNIYLLGDYNQVQFGSASHTNVNAYSAQYFAKFNSTGQLDFLQGITSGVEAFYNFNVMSSGIFFTGHGHWTSGGWTKTEKYNSAGIKQWTKSYSGFYYSYSSSSLAENGNGIYTIGAEKNPNVPQWVDTYALMLSSFDSNGQQTCTYINSSGHINPTDILNFNAHEYLIAGNAPDTIVFGNTPVMKSNGNIFIAKFMNGIPTIVKNNSINKDQISIVPNPSSGQFKILLPENLKAGSYTVYDLSGRSIFTQTLNDDTVIDLTGHTKGIYFLEITAGYERISKKLILD